MTFRSTVLTALMVSLFPTVSHSAIIQLDFTGKVTAITDWELIIGTRIPLGTPVKASIRYDTLWPDSSPDAGQGSYEDMPGWLKVTIGGLLFEETISYHMDVENPSAPPFSAFHVFTQGNPTGWPASLPQLEFSEINTLFSEIQPPFDLLSSDAPPASFEITRADAAFGWVLAGRRDAGTVYAIQFELTQQPEIPVPEPGTLSLLALGFATVGVRRRFHQRSVRRRRYKPGSHAPSAHHRAVIGGAMQKVALLSLLFGAVSVAQATAGPIQGFSYTAGTFTTIDMPGINTQTMGINDAGQIVGFSYVGGGPNRVFQYATGTFTPIPLPLPPGSRFEVPYGINDAGQIVGSFEDSSGGRHGFLYDGGTLTTIDVPGSVSTGVSGINDAGQMVGGFGLPGGGARGFIRDTDGSFTTLDGPGGIAVGLSDINDAGQIAGEFFDGTTAHGLFYDAGSFTTLDPPGSLFTSARGINDAGEVVGIFVGSDSIIRSFLYSAGSYTIVSRPGSATLAEDINDAGQIVGYSYTQSSIPEPGSMLMLGSGLAGIWAFASRKRRAFLRNARQAPSSGV